MDVALECYEERVVTQQVSVKLEILASTCCHRPLNPVQAG